MDPGFVCATWSNYFNVFWLFLGLCPVLGCIWAYVLSLAVFGPMSCPWLYLGLCLVLGCFWAYALSLGAFGPMSYSRLFLGSCFLELCPIALFHDPGNPCRRARIQSKRTPKPDNSITAWKVIVLSTHQSKCDVEWWKNTSSPSGATHRQKWAGKPLYCGSTVTRQPISSVIMIMIIEK